MTASIKISNTKIHNFRLLKKIISIRLINKIMDNGEVEQQLQQVENTLLVGDITEDERKELISLKENLLELQALSKQLSDSPEENHDKQSEMDSEMERFVKEIDDVGGGNGPEKQDESSSSSKDSEDSDDSEKFNLQLEAVKASLEDLIGRKCSAPHQHSWGAVAYHNAIVCGIKDEFECNDEGNFDFQLRVLFTNPTHREMLPCSYYLNGQCKFDSEKCHYSHGEVVLVNELRDYKEPDFERLQRNCMVLAKLDDSLWHRGQVMCVNMDEKTCRVRLDSQKHKEREKDLAFEDLFPITTDSEDSDSDSSDESDSEELDDFDEEKEAYMVEKNVFTINPTQPLGAWEKYTRGIGSKLMAKMGYEYGTGLGTDGRGIVAPVTAQILPQGRSLDHCMKLREAANGDKDLFSAERKLQKQQKKQELANAKAYERELQNKDVFSFLNENILSSNNAKKSNGNDKMLNKPSLQEQSTKSLNVESVRIADDIKRKEREIAHVQAAMKRNASNSEIHKNLRMNLDAKNRELNILQKQEQNLSKEQASRKTKDKLTIF